MTAAPRIVIAAGGTAGHVVPAIAIAGALRAEGAEVVFVGGERAEAQLVPAAGYPLETIRVEGISRSNPLKAARALARAVTALGAAARILARLAPDAVLGGGGYVAGPVGLAAVARRVPLVLTEADSHLGLTNRAARAAGPPRLPGVPDRRAQRPALSRHRAARAAHGQRPRAGARRLRPARAGRLRTGLRGLAGGALDQPCGGARPTPGRPSTCSTSPGRATSRSSRRPGRTTSCSSTSSPSARRCWPPTSRSHARAARCSSSRSTACRRSSCPIRTPAADHQAGNALWMAGAGAAVVIEDEQLSPERLARETGALLGRSRSASSSMARASARLARPDAARAVAHELLSAIEPKSSPK